jgi:class 3 adenylate cyclase
VETFTFLFTDIEGSTRLLRRLGEGAYTQVLASHHALIRSALAAHGGQEVDTQGDAFFAVFSSPTACVAAVILMQQAIGGQAWPAGERVRVRMGVHTGEASKTATGVVGLDVHRAARVAAVAYGGQVLLSETAAALVRGSLPPGAALRDLGVHRLKDLGRPEQVFSSWRRRVWPRSSRRCVRWVTRRCRTISRPSCPPLSAATGSWPRSSRSSNPPAWSP